MKVYKICQKLNSNIALNYAKLIMFANLITSIAAPRKNTV